MRKSEYRFECPGSCTACSPTAQIVGQYSKSRCLEAYRGLRTGLVPLRRQNHLSLPQHQGMRPLFFLRRSARNHWDGVPAPGATCWALACSDLRQHSISTAFTKGQYTMDITPQRCHSCKEEVNHQSLSPRC